MIKNYSSTEINSAMEQVISSKAIVITDNWPSYRKAVGDRFQITEYSGKGKNFELLHWHIFNLKNWIRGIHHKISVKHLQNYLDEFHYKFNRRNNIPSCPARVLNRIV